MEGWLKWSSVDGECDLVAAGDDSAGVRMFVSAAGGTTRLNVYAREAWPGSPIAAGFFDADLSGYAGKWVHLAVAYDPSAGNGTWTLFVEGRPAGAAILNCRRPTMESYFRSGAFSLGAADRPFGCSLDMWRISSGVVRPEELLWRAYRRLTISMR